MIKFDIIIIGSGVAGLTAGIYASKGNKKVLILEENFLGGVTATINKIENYPGMPNCSGFELVHNMYMQANSFGTDFNFGKILNIDFDNCIIDFISNDNQDHINYIYDCLIIAGGSTVKKLNVKGENEFQNRGVSYCAVCDGSLYKDQSIIVVTDNNSAKSEIEYLKNITSDITVLDIDRGYSSDDIKYFSNVTVKEIVGETKFEKVIFECNDKKHEINANAIFIEIGRFVDLHLYENKLNIKNGHICSDENMHTCIDNVFVAGDIRDKNLRQIVTSCADGAIASTEAIKYLNKKQAK